MAGGVILLNVPNVLTFIRFLIVPIFGVYLFLEYYVIAVSLFIIAGITDVLDGYIARKFNLITNFGKIADPMADKLMQLTALVILTYLNKIPILILIIILSKELLMGIGSILLYKKDHFVVSANWYGKLSSVIFYFAIIVLIINDENSTLKNLLVWVAVCSALFAFYMYSRTYRDIRDNKKINSHSRE
jgi:cardiolipin synthase (CMP-forming)